MEVLAGSGSEGLADGAGAAAQFYCSWGVAVDGEGNIIIADGGISYILFGLLLFFAYLSKDIRVCYKRPLSSSSSRQPSSMEVFAGSGRQGFADGAGAAARHFTGGFPWSESLVA